MASIIKRNIQLCDAKLTLPTPGLILLSYWWNYIREEILWCIMFVDGVMMVNENKEGLDAIIKVCRKFLESKDFKISMMIQEHMKCIMLKWSGPWVLCNCKILLNLKEFCIWQLQEHSYFYGWECWTIRKHVQEIGLSHNENVKMDEW